VRAAALSVRGARIAENCAMYRRRQNRKPQTNRRGIILLVVLAMLTLFMVVGLTFVFYAETELESSQLGQQAANASVPDMEAELALSFALRQIIYGAPNDSTGYWSSLRGHGLATNMYGFNDAAGADNSVPYSSVGRLHLQVPNGQGPAAGTDEFNNINYMVFPDGWNHDPERVPAWRQGLSAPIGTFTAFSPSYTYPDVNNIMLAAVDSTGKVLTDTSGNVAAISGHRAYLFGPLFDPNSPTNPQNNPNWGNIAGNPNPQGKYLILRPRPWDNPPVQVTVNGVTVTKPGFPYPEDPGGDVKNLIGAPGGNDSIWIDIGAPVMSLPDGRKYKMLIAPLIMDLDGRVNLNVHGNIMPTAVSNPTNFSHASNQGFGKWEVNLGKVLLNPGGGPRPEWTNVFLGNGTFTFPGNGNPVTPVNPSTISGRYGLNGVLGNPSTPPGSQDSRFYSMTDLNGCQDFGVPTAGQPSSPLIVPTYNATPSPTSPPLSLFPSLLQANGYSDGLNATSPANYPPPGSNTPPIERTWHAYQFNYFRPLADDRVFALSNMEALMRHGDTNSPALTSDLYRLLPSNMPIAQIRNLVTTHSFDLDRAGITPYIWYSPTNAFPAADPTRYAMGAQGIPLGQPIAFPTQRSANPPPVGEFDPATWRALSAALGRIDLNRINSFVPYPSPTPTGRIDPTAQPPAPYNTQFANNGQMFTAAQGQRQQIAREIYNRLAAVTGAIDPNSVDPTSATYKALVPQPPNFTEVPEFQAARWLAQLSVNIVDYIDSDDISTPLNWFTDGTQNPPKQYYVFGTELPRVVINEVYSEISNDGTDPFTGGVATLDYRVKSWVELYNAFSKPVYLNPNHTPADNGDALLQVNDPAGNYAVYQLAITDSNPSIRSSFNFLGDPDATVPVPAAPVPAPTVRCLVADWSPDATFTPRAADYPLIHPNGNAYGNPADPIAGGGGGINGLNMGFYVVGPIDPFPSIAPGLENGVPVPVATLAVKDQTLTAGTPPGYGTTVVNGLNQPGTVMPSFRSSMVYNVPKATAVANFPTTNSVLLRRLACPGLPPDLNPASPTYNPYVTVDYLPEVPINDAVSNSSAGLNVQQLVVPKRLSYGKREPYAATPIVAQQPAFPPAAGFTLQPQHTMFRHNGVQAASAVANGNPDLATNGPTLNIPFHWLTHLDRQLITPGELLQVSGWKPHELTQQFIVGAPQGSNPAASFCYQHTAPWLNQQARIYRALELLQIGDRAAGCSTGGRLPGKININTIWSDNQAAAYSLVFRALCDAQSSNIFYGGAPPNSDAVVDAVFSAMIKWRTPTQPDPTNTPGLYIPGQNDHPFLGMAPGFVAAGDNQYLLGTGIQQTVLAPNPAPAYPNQLLFGVPVTAPNAADPNQTHPYQQDSLISKIFSNVTTRSNVFAVYLTVGFFEVNDDTTRPVKLGAELGRSENRHVRHRMFAIVDRTNLAVAATMTTQAISAAASTPAVAPQGESQQTVSLAAVSGTDPRTGRPWAIQQAWGIPPPAPAPPSPGAPLGAPLVQPGTQLVFEPNDPGGNEETVNVLQVDPGNSTITAVFTKNHPNGATVIIRGNPGPWTRYDPRQDTAVVPYFSIID
jgi:hypothetical protein